MKQIMKIKLSLNKEICINITFGDLININDVKEIFSNMGYASKDYKFNYEIKNRRILRNEKFIKLNRIIVEINMQKYNYKY